jgi:hypothetical protein
MFVPVFGHHGIAHLMRCVVCIQGFYNNATDKTVNRSLKNMRIQPFNGKGPCLLLWVGSRLACGKITVSGIPNCVNYSVIILVNVQYTDMVAGNIIKPGGL